MTISLTKKQLRCNQAALLKVAWIRTGCPFFQCPVNQPFTNIHHIKGEHLDYIKDINQLIVDNFLFGDENDLKNNASLLENGIIDSTGVLELISFLEETYKITIEDDEMIPDNLDSMNNINNFLKKKLSD